MRIADRKIKRAVKKIFKLPTHIIDETLYTPMKIGGLGVFSFVRKIPVIMLDRLERVQNKCTMSKTVIKEIDGWMRKITRMIKPVYRTASEIDSSNASTSPSMEETPFNHLTMPPLDSS